MSNDEVLAGTCNNCGDEVDRAAIDAKTRLSLKLRPGQPVAPPKLCSQCVWEVIISAEENS